MFEISFDKIGIDPKIVLGTFCISHPNMKFPEKGHIFYINEGNYNKFPEGVKKFIKYCQEDKDDRPYNSRYFGALVSDFHRNLIKGGLCLYPSILKHP